MISIWINELKNYGYLSVEIQRKENKEIEKRVIKITEVWNKNSIGYGTNIPEGMEQKLPENNTSINIINSNNINTNTDTETEKQFSKFINEYPKKTKLENVKRWFSINKPSEDLFNLIMQKVKDFKEYECKGKEVRFIPDAYTWLLDKRYNDDFKPLTLLRDDMKPANKKFINYTPREYDNDFYESLDD